jgi:RNA polymerase sigma factor (sigma-70 family)
MATSEMSEVIQHLRRTVLLRDGAGLTDGQLLEDYISRRDEAALAALVRRHGPMVWGVCRRVLRSHHDAEDAFQATFLVLVRKAASIVPRQMVANWLYGVARQTALNARATAAKRKGRERQVTEMPEPAVAEQDLWRDLQPLLDEELCRLPDKYRAVIVLCDLEGKTRKEAARQLGVPEGTIGGWVARARVMLAKRLAQRGVVLSGGALAAVLSQNVGSAGVPPSVVSSTIKAATLFAAGQAAGMISVKVAALTEGVLKTMLFTNLKVVMLLLVAAALCGTAGLIYQTQAAEQPTTQEAARQPDKEGQPAADKPAARTEGKPAPTRDELQGQWEGTKDGVKVHLTLDGEKGHWQVEFTRNRKPKEASQSPDVEVRIGADLKCIPDLKGGHWSLYLPAYLGQDKEIKKHPALTGSAAVAEITRREEGAIQLRIIPTGYEDLDRENYDYPAVEGLTLRRVAK